MTSFHVRHDFTPHFARTVLLLLRTAAPLTEEQLLTSARARDLDLGRRQSITKVLASLRDLGLATYATPQPRGSVMLTPLGHHLAEIAVADTLLFAELMHLCHWWRWHPADERDYFSWSYQTVATLLWDEAPTPLESDRLVYTILAAAEERFGLSGVSFSTASVAGILQWLRVLSPPCIRAKTFYRRPGCPPEALVIALEGITQIQGMARELPIRLDQRTRRQACRVTLLDPAAFDDVLSQAEATLGITRRVGDGGETLLLRESLVPGVVPQRDQP